MEHVYGTPLTAGIIVLLVIAALVGTSIGFKGYVQF